MLKVRVIDLHSAQVLFECPVQDADRAYIVAGEYEAMGLEVKVEHPTVNQTLADSLGVTGTPLEEFETSMKDELEDHPGSCCFSDKSDKTLH